MIEFAARPPRSSSGGRPPRTALEIRLAVWQKTTLATEGVFDFE
jgi:hypothetical protein